VAGRDVASALLRSELPNAWPMTCAGSDFFAASAGGARGATAPLSAEFAATTAVGRGEFICGGGAAGAGSLEASFLLAIRSAGASVVLHFGEWNTHGRLGPPAADSDALAPPEAAEAPLRPTAVAFFSVLAGIDDDGASLRTEADGRAARLGSGLRAVASEAIGADAPAGCASCAGG
jgi:hypothetical protein